jgi:hypothetical protein
MEGSTLRVRSFAWLAANGMRDGKPGACEVASQRGFETCDVSYRMMCIERLLVHPITVFYVVARLFSVVLREASFRHCASQVRYLKASASLACRISSIASGFFPRLAEETLSCRRRWDQLGLFASGSSFEMLYFENRVSCSRCNHRPSCSKMYLIALLGLQTETWIR